MKWRKLAFLCHQISMPKITQNILEVCDSARRYTIKVEQGKDSTQSRIRSILSKLIGLSTQVITTTQIYALCNLKDQKMTTMV